MVAVLAAQRRAFKKNKGISHADRAQASEKDRSRQVPRFSLGKETQGIEKGRDLGVV